MLNTGTYTGTEWHRDELAISVLFHLNHTDITYYNTNVIHMYIVLYIVYFHLVSPIYIW